MTEARAGRRWFSGAGEGFVELVRGVRPADLERPGLGEWTVRDLIGHTGRAFSTVVDYRAAPVDPAAALVPDAVAYFAAARTVTIDQAAIAERGRAAGRALGDDPLAAVLEARGRALAVLDETADAEVLPTALGPMRLIDYLDTRGFELTVHGLDLAYALGVDAPEATERWLPAALRLLAGIADGAQAAHAVRALGGRAPLPVGFSLL